MTEPVVTRAHRRAAYNAMFNTDNGEELSPYTEEWVATGTGSWISLVTGNRVALALATVEHNARREAEHRAWHVGHEAGFGDGLQHAIGNERDTPCPYSPPGATSDV